MADPQPAAMAAPVILRNADLDAEAVWQARVDLAACFRAAAAMGLHEGICNHFSARKPDTCVIYPGTPVLGSLNVQGSYASCTRCSASTNRSWKA